MNAPDIVIPPAIGMPFVGGLYAGQFCVGERVYGLIVAPATVGELAETTWGGTKKVAGALRYNDGLANTEAMAKAGSALGKWARGLRIEGLDDWYLPSRLEALILFGEGAALGDFVDDYYWTSTQYAGDGAYAWCQSFDLGGQDYDRKLTQLRARAVRRFLIQ